MKLNLYCSCGGALQGTVTPDSKAKEIIFVWNNLHAGIGHSPVDSKTAARARRKAEKEDMIAYSIDNYADLED